uniref:HAT C-terminal dimerisation domain-containing protein n=1 Tax=Cajanus cajan TaxID=3821 RepID=A0A151SLV1_CAJCA|nr:hypothetical protein KK1_002059 [Cajanus cajan]
MHQNSLLKKRKVGPLEKAFNLENRDNLKALIARMFYSSGLPFNLARNPYYVNSYSFAANHMLNGFLPPGYNALRTTLLQQEKAQVERLLKPIKSTWNAKGVSIVSDGWTDVQRRPLINFMATSEGGPIFLKAINASDEIKNKHYMADKMIEVITLIEKMMWVRPKLILNDMWWDKITYILNFTEPIYSMLRACNTDSPTLHLVYEMWDNMIEKVKTSIYRYEGKELNDTSTFYEVVYSILIDRWTKSCTPLHCMAHSLNPRYYNDEWLQEAPNIISPHEDEKNSMERNKYRWTLDAKSWWVMHGSSAPLLQKLSLKLLVQPSSSSCCERNWSTYSFIHSLKRNKLNPKRAEDLVYVHTNLRILSRKSEEYMQGSTRMWDIGGDAWDSFGGVENLEVTSLSLDEPEMKGVLFTDDGQGGDEIDTILIS